MSIDMWTILRRRINDVAFRSAYAAQIQMAPAFICFAALFVVPLILLIWISLWRYEPNAFAPTALTLENYQRFLTDGFYLKALMRSIYLGLITTAITILIAYPLAYIMTKVSSGMRSAIILLVLFPLMISVVVRVFGWMVILGDTGIINNMLMAIGLINEPIHIMESVIAVVVGLVQVWMAFAVLPIYSSLMAINRHLEEASSTLGASKWRSFKHITLPLSVPGIAAAVSLVFSLTVASFVQPQLLGGSGYIVMTTLIYQQISVTLNWPFAAAIGIILLVFAVLALFLMNMVMKLFSPKGSV